MTRTSVIRPKSGLLVGCIVAVFAAPAALYFVPNPFENLAPGQAPVRFFLVLWVLLPSLMALALWRLFTWTTYQPTTEALLVRGWFGARALPWSDLTSAQLDTPIGMPPAYELRFGGKKIRFIAAHFSRDLIRSLKPYLAEASIAAM